MADRIFVDQLEEKPLIEQSQVQAQKITQPDDKQQNNDKSKQGEKDPNSSPPDMRTEVPPGDPEKEGASHSKTEMQQIEIATPTSRLLLQIEDHFPLDPWPDLLIIDEIKVSLVYKRPFSSGNVQSVLIKDITDVSIGGNPLWSALSITGGDFKGSPAAVDKSTFGKGPLKMRFLNKAEGAKARRLILGLMILNARKVDTSKMPVTEVVQRAEELGRA